MISYFLLFAPLLEIFKYVVYVMVFLCCIKYLKKMISFLSPASHCLLDVR